MQEKIKKKHDEITHIQNAVWKIYKEFLSDHDMKEYNRKAGELTEEYYKKGEPQLLTFCQHILISWCPVINTLAEEFRSEEKKGGGAGDGESIKRI